MFAMIFANFFKYVHNEERHRVFSVASVTFRAFRGYPNWRIPTIFSISNRRLKRIPPNIPICWSELGSKQCVRAFELADQILTEDSNIEPDKVELDEENGDNFHPQSVEESLQSL